MTFDLRAPEPVGLVRPVPVDPSGVHGPTRGAAAGPRWRRTSPNRYVRSDTPDSVEQRILVIRVLEEGVTNALRHGHAGTLDVSVAVGDDGVLAIELDDDGSGLGDTGRSDWSGLAALDERLTALGGELRLGASPLGGSRLSARLPLTPSATPS